MGLRYGEPVGAVHAIDSVYRIPGSLLPYVGAVLREFQIIVQFVIDG